MSSRASAADSASGAEPMSRPLHVPLAASNILPIPLRSDLTVHVQGLPFDLSPAEAKKIAAVIQAMAMVE